MFISILYDRVQLDKTFLLSLVNLNAMSTK